MNTDISMKQKDKLFAACEDDSKYFKDKRNNILNYKENDDINKNQLNHTNKKTLNKLEYLLSQPDIFEYLKRINTSTSISANGVKKDQNSSQNMHSQTNNNDDHTLRHKKTENEEDNVLSENLDADEYIRLEEQPPNLKFGILRDYQLEGLNWLYKLYRANLNGILADEMGLGKTIQAISIMAKVEEELSEEQKTNRHSYHIVIVPKITIQKWNKEINEWLPSARLFVFYGDHLKKEELKDTRLRARDFDILLTTYEVAISEKGPLSKLEYDFIIVDEAQRIKNDQSVLAQVLRKYRTKHRLLLTGTPLQNNLKELWSLLNFVMPSLFDSAEEFSEFFNIKTNDPQEQEAVIKKVHRLLRPFMLRRLKADVEKQLPPKKEIYLFMGLSELQKKVYKQILSKNIDVVNGGGDRIALLNILMQLKKVCNHPYLFDGVEPGPPFIDGEHLVENSFKFKVLDRLLPRLQEQGSKVLVFSQMTRLLDILDDYCRYRGYKYCRIDGQTSAIDRELRIEDFQFEGSDKFIFLLSTRAGGIGINLHAANTVIIYDSDWNPQVDLQAIDRAHRIGQKREVVIYRFVTDGSVEEKIVERAAKKLKIDHLIMQKGRFSNDTTKVSDKEMVQIIQFGAKKILANEKGLINEENIDELLKYGVEKTEHLNHELKKFENKYSLNNFSINDEEQNMYVFEGEDYKKKRKEVEPILETKIEFIDIGSRERKATSYDINQYYRTALNNNTAPPKEKKKLTGWRAKANGGYKHQFFDISKLDQLEEKERAWKEFQELKKEDEKLVMKSPPRYTEKDANLIDKLLAEGFPNWSKKDFYSYIHGCEKWTRDNYEKIAEEMKSKPPEEVEEYSQVFWKRWNEIENGERYVERIKKGEADMKKQSEIENVLNFKFSKLTNEGNNTLLDNIHIEYNKNAKTTSYSNEEDKMIAFCLYKYGYGSWELMRNEIRNSEQFRYTYNYLNSRSNVELQRRSDHLISLFKKESEEKAKTKQQKQQKLGKSRNGKLMIEVPADKIKSKSRQAKGSKEDSKPVKKVLGKRKASIKDDKKKSKRAKASGSKPEAKIEIKKGKKDDNAEDEEVGEFESQSSYTP